MQLTTLSKTISYALRHHPEEFGLTLDPEGWVALSDLIAALKAHSPSFNLVAVHHFEEIQRTAEKQRFELKDGRIRALYGHSTTQKIEKQAQQPPEFLFHGTTHKAMPVIRDKGLQPMSRQFVHLSTELGTAQMVGSRRDRRPPILRVKALEAWQSGILFYHGNQDTWLAEGIPPQFLIFPE